MKIMNEYVSCEGNEVCSHRFLFPMPKKQNDVLLYLTGVPLDKSYKEDDDVSPSGYVFKHFTFSPVDYLKKYLLADKTFAEVVDEYTDVFDLDEMKRKELYEAVQTESQKYVDLVPCTLTLLFEEMPSFLGKHKNVLLFTLQSRKQALHCLRKTYLSDVYGERNEQHFEHPVSRFSLCLSDKVKQVDDALIVTIEPGTNSLVHQQDLFVKKLWFSYLDCCFHIELYVHKNAVIKDLTMHQKIRIERVDFKSLNKDL